MRARRRISWFDIRLDSTPLRSSTAVYTQSDGPASIGVTVPWTIAGVPNVFASTCGPVDPRKVIIQYDRAHRIAPHSRATTLQHARSFDLSILVRRVCLGQAAQMAKSESSGAVLATSEPWSL